jgi:hypothetical protein
VISCANCKAKWHRSNNVASSIIQSLAILYRYISQQRTISLPSVPHHGDTADTEADRIVCLLFELWDIYEASARSSVSEEHLVGPVHVCTSRTSYELGNPHDPGSLVEHAIASMGIYVTVGSQQCPLRISQQCLEYNRYDIFRVRVI